MYRTSGTAYRTHFCDDDKILEVRMQRLPDQLVRNMRSVEVVIDAALYGFPEYGDGCRLVSRRTEYTRPGLGHT
jgi:hypothetical protein